MAAYHRSRSMQVLLALMAFSAAALSYLALPAASQPLTYPRFRYIGCWPKSKFVNDTTNYGEGVQQSTILPAVPPPTGWSCAEWCRNQGYPMSALSQNHECRCGFFWRARREVDGCGPCSGNAEFNCSLTADSTAVHFTLPDWPMPREIGCHFFSPPRPGLEIYLPPASVLLDFYEPRSCAAVCQKRGYPYSGISSLFYCNCLMETLNTGIGSLCTSIGCYAKFVSKIKDYVPDNVKCGGTDTIALYGHQSGAPVVTTTPDSTMIRVSIGDPLPNFTCRGTVNSLWALLRISWVKDGAIGSNELLTPKMAVGDVSQDYSIGQASGRDTGDYSCYVESLGESVAGNKIDFNLVRLRVYTIPSASITQSVVATGQPFTMSCHGHGNGTFNYSWPQSNSGTADATGQNLSFVQATKELATMSFKCQVTVEETKRTAFHTTELVVLDPPVANVVPSLTVAAVGDNMELTCDASGDPPITFTWVGPGNTQSEGSTWVVKNVTMNHGGLYTCTATNTRISDSSFASSRKTAAVTIETNPPRTSVSIEATSGQVYRNSQASNSYVLLPQTSAQLNCTVTGQTPRLIVGWYRLSPERTLISNNSLLQLMNVTGQEDNTYVCQALDPVITTPARSHETLLSINVFVSPQVTLSSQPSVHVVGDNVQIPCSFEGDPPENFTWTRGGQVFSSQQKLSFEPISKTDSGVYTCKISSRPADLIPSYSHEGNISVIVQVPPRAAVPSRQVTIKPGSNLTLRCSVTGERSVTSSWLFGNTLITPSQRFLLNQTGNALVLTVVSASQQDAGTYKCRAEDKTLVDWNRRVHSVEVSVQGPVSEETSSDDNITLPVAIVCAIIGVALILIVVIIIVRQRRQNAKRKTGSEAAQAENGTATRKKSSDTTPVPSMAYSNLRMLESIDGDSTPAGHLSLVSSPSKSTCASHLSPQVSNSSQPPPTPPRLNPIAYDYCASGPRPSQEIIPNCRIYDYARVKANSWMPAGRAQETADSPQELLSHYDYVKSTTASRHSCPPDPSNTHEDVLLQDTAATVTSAEVLARVVQRRMTETDFGSDDDEYQDPSYRNSFQLSDIPCAGLPCYGTPPPTAQSWPTTAFDFTLYAKPDKEKKLFAPMDNLYETPRVGQLQRCRTLSNPYEVPQLPPRTFQDDDGDVILNESVCLADDQNSIFSERQLTTAHTHLSHNLEDDSNMTESYQEPPNTPQSIYNKLADQRYKHILPQDLQLDKELAKGQFGKVLCGTWKQGDCMYNVAVKQLHPGAEDQDRIHFLQEGIVMGQFRHPNIVRLYGVVTAGEPMMLVLEMMEKGCLELILPLMMPADLEKPRRQLKSLLLNMTRDVACGMDYLAQKGFIHRDLAARNIYVDAKNVCKIRAFEMSRDLADNNYYISSSGVMIPIRWTAPEAINYLCYSTASDVWSFGVLLYEIWSFGRTPYGFWSNEKVRSKVLSGYRMPAPAHCPFSISQIMQLCWMTDPQKRPTFSEIVMILSVKDVCLLSS